MLIRFFSALAIATTAGLFFGPDASATSRFTIQNDNPQKVTVRIYHGDSSCRSPNKTKKVSGGETGHYSCSGNGEHRCKVKLQVDGKLICKEQMNTCDKKARKVDDAGYIRVARARDGSAFFCEFY
ncbi:MAG: hypothetical protein Hens2KO_25090 [Henriciella sp.]